MVVFAREKQKKLTTWEKKWLFHRSYWFFFIHLSYSRFSCVLVHKRPHKHTDKPHSVSSSYYSLRERETRRTLLKKSFSLLLGGCWRFFFTYIFNDVYVWFEGENYEALSLSLSCTRGQIGVREKKILSEGVNCNFFTAISII